MPDITMCSGRFEKGPACPKRRQCYRHEATPSKNQSWFALLPITAGTADCAYFIPVTRDADSAGAEQ